MIAMISERVTAVSILNPIYLYAILPDIQPEAVWGIVHGFAKGFVGERELPTQDSIAFIQCSARAAQIASIPSNV
jgi:hypothetical protein